MFNSRHGFLKIPVLLHVVIIQHLSRRVDTAVELRSASALSFFHSSCGTEGYFKINSRNKQEHALLTHSGLGSSWPYIPSEFK